MTTPTVRVKVRGVIRNDDGILLCELRSGDFYCLPGGTLEPGETLVECLEREIHEELGIQAQVGKLLHMQDFVRESGTTIDFWYEITNPGDFLSIDLSQASHGHENSRVQFIALTEFEQYIIKPLNMREILDK